MTERIELADLKANLEKIVSRISGTTDEVVIEDHGKPVVRLLAASGTGSVQDMEKLRASWKRLQAAARTDLTDDEVMEIAVEAQREYREELRRKLAAK